MIDSYEILAQSCTFAVIDGNLQSMGPPVKPEIVFQPGDVIDSKYTIISSVGSGGMGVIYKARHMNLQREVALKTISSSHVSGESWKRFQLEATAIAKLRHKNIVHVFDFGISESGLPYYTMELLTGESLAQLRLKTDQLSTIDTLNIFGQVAQALAHAHKNKIVHRDIKPGNIFLASSDRGRTGQWEAKLVDFGIAKLAAETMDRLPAIKPKGSPARKGDINPKSSPPAAVEANINDQVNTRVGTVFGSPLYMSPEQSMGLPTDTHTDMYSFGCALYETITGVPPFAGDNAFNTIMLHQTANPPTLKENRASENFPSRLEALVKRLLAKNPDDRFNDFDQIVSEIETCKQVVRAQAKNSAAGAAELKADQEKVLLKVPLKERKKAPLFPIMAISSISLALAAFLLFTAFPGMISPALNSVAAKKIPASKSLPSSPATNEDSKDFIPTQQEMPFFVGIKQEGHRLRKTFSFPDEPIGKLTAMNRKIDAIPCAGIKNVDPDLLLCFEPDWPCIKEPALLSRFRKDDLYAFYVGSSPELSKKHLQAMKSMTDLAVMDLSGEHLTADCMEPLSQFKKLRVLILSKTALTGRDIVNLKTLPELTTLRVNYLEDLSPVWDYLATHNSQVDEIEANGCIFTPEDMAKIGSLKKLTRFTACGSNLTEEMLSRLAPAPSLIVLSILGNPLHPGIEKKIHKIKQLDYLFLTRRLGPFKQSQWDQVRSAMHAGAKLIDLDYEAPNFAEYKKIKEEEE